MIHVQIFFLNNLFSFFINKKQHDCIKTKNCLQLQFITAMKTYMT